MRTLFTLATLAAACYGFFWWSDTQPDIKNKLQELLNTGSFNTLEVRYSSAQIMEAQRKHLLKSGKHRYLDPTMKFYPYLLMEVKYVVSNRKTKESIILWDLTDGEMVVNTKNWDRTHGFSDCIHAGINRNEFKVISALASRGGVTDRRTLCKLLHVEQEILDNWLEGCRKKRLIVQTANRYRLHLEKPFFQPFPFTKIDQHLVTKAHKNTERVTQRFSLSQIEGIARSAFGTDFVIRKTADLYLPVHCITVENPDGSIHTTHWNALNGKQMHTHFVD